jgi:hypothetical protein
MMERSLDWDLRLANYLAEMHAKPFVWGQHDCARFAAGWVLLATGVDLFGPWRGRYDSAANAVDVGGSRFEQLQSHCDRLLGASKSIVFAKRGDIVLVEQRARKALAVCIGDKWAGPGAAGLVYQPLAIAQMVWSV